jgi:hypothetical protein
MSPVWLGGYDIRGQGGGGRGRRWKMEDGRWKIGDRRWKNRFAPSVPWQMCPFTSIRVHSWFSLLGRGGEDRSWKIGPASVLYLCHPCHPWLFFWGWGGTGGRRPKDG